MQAPKQDPREPSLLEPVTPRPWETVVRIKVHTSEHEWGFGSGTIIFSSAEESIILTHANLFRIKGQTQPAPVHFRLPISVDLFGGQFVQRQPSAMLACTEKDLLGEAIDYDFANNVALIRIKPGRKLPASRVVPADWRPKKGMSMITVGCSHGNDATAWNTTILDPGVMLNISSTHYPIATIKCAHQPQEGRTGGGLYTTDNFVAGVCAFADPNEHAGIYAGPQAIYRILDRNRLSKLYEDMEEVTANGRNTPANVDVDIHGFRYPAPKDLVSAAGRSTPNQTTVEPVSPRPVSDQERRLGDLERKLDQILRALEDLKGNKAPDRPESNPSLLKR